MPIVLLFLYGYNGYVTSFKQGIGTKHSGNLAYLLIALIKVRERLLEQILPQRTAASSVLSPGWLKRGYCVTMRATCWMQHTPGNLLRESNSSQIFTRALYPQIILRFLQEVTHWVPVELCHPTSLGFSLSWIRRGFSYKVWFNSTPMRWTLPDPYPHILCSPGTKPPGDTPQSTGHILGPPRLSTSLLLTE